MKGGRDRRVRPAATIEERVAVAVIVAFAAVGAALAGAHPTGNRVSDVLFAGALAATVTLAASVARSWSWVASASMAAVFAADDHLLTAIALEAFAIGGALVDVPRRRIVGALVGAAAVQLTLRMGDGPFFGSTALVAAAAVTPLLVSGWTRSRRPVRVWLGRAALGFGVLAVVACGLAGLGLLRARGDVNRAVAHVRAGVDLERQGDSQAASQELAAAARSFAAANDAAGAWWTAPASLLPVVGKQVSSVDRLTAAGGTVASAAARASTEADVNGFRMLQGRVDIAKIAAAAKPLADVRSALVDVERSIGAARTGWLVDPLSRRLEDFATQIERAASDAELAAQIVAVAPSMLGDGTVRHYFVVFGNPAETRDLGGFAGGYGELVIDHGKIELVHTGKASELNAGGPHALTEPSKVPERLQELQIDRFWQNTTGAPDFPAVAEGIRQLWPQSSGGGQLDGVLYVDPYALSALLRLTGPVTVPGVAQRLTAQNIVSFLTQDQYVELKVSDERHDVLSDVAKVVVDKVTSTDLPGPRQVGAQLGPAAYSGHLFLNSFHPDEQSLFRRLEIDGAVSPNSGDDFLLVTTSNRVSNKIDAYMRRATEDRVTYNPVSGEVDATVRVNVHNAAPSSGVPDYVIGNHLGLPTGTNEMIVSVSTPLDLLRATVDGAPVSASAHAEYGLRTYSAQLDIPPGAVAVFELHLHGYVRPGDTYRLTAVPRANVGVEHLTVSVSASGEFVTDSHEVSEELVTRSDFSVVFRRAG